MQEDKKAREGREEEEAREALADLLATNERARSFVDDAVLWETADNGATGKKAFYGYLRRDVEVAKVVGLVAKGGVVYPPVGCPQDVREQWKGGFSDRERMRQCLVDFVDSRRTLKELLLYDLGVYKSVKRLLREMGADDSDDVEISSAAFFLICRGTFHLRIFCRLAKALIGADLAKRGDFHGIDGVHLHEVYRHMVKCAEDNEGYLEMKAELEDVGIY